MCEVSLKSRSGKGLVFATLILPLFAAQADYVSNVLALNPVGYWHLDDSASTVVADSSGNANDGSVNSAVGMGITDVPLLGIPGNTAFDFDHSNAASLVGLPTGLASSSAGSISLWFKTNPATMASQANMLFYGSSVTNGDGFGSQNELHLHLTTTGELSLGIYGSGGTRNIVTVGTYHDDQWHHVLASWDSLSDTTALYVDGDGEIITGAHSASTFTFSGITRLGKTAGAGSSASRLFGGLMDEAALFDRALTAQDALVLSSVVPEPSVGSLFLLGGLGILIRRLRSV